jgi:hypothetical protein
MFNPISDWEEPTEIEGLTLYQLHGEPRRKVCCWTSFSFSFFLANAYGGAPAQRGVERVWRGGRATRRMHVSLSCVMDRR